MITVVLSIMIATYMKCSLDFHWYSYSRPTVHLLEYMHTVTLVTIGGSLPPHLFEYMHTVNLVTIGGFLPYASY